MTEKKAAGSEPTLRRDLCITTLKRQGNQKKYY